MQEVWAVMYCEMIYESAFSVMSLHRTKAGAWHAMREFMFDCCEKERNFAITHGGKWLMSRKPLAYNAFRIESYEINE